MRPLLLICALPALLAADDHWVKFTRGPFEVLTDAGRAPGRETMVRLEQFRHALGAGPGRDRPARRRSRCASSSSRTRAAGPPPRRSAKAATATPSSWTEKAPDVAGHLSRLARLFLQVELRADAARLRERAVSFFSTFDRGRHPSTAGTPPAKPDLDWARIHLMMTDPDYFGKIRVLLYNLRRGVADDPAYRNAFGKSAAEVEGRRETAFRRGQLPDRALASAPMSESDFPERPVLRYRHPPGARRSAGRCRSPSTEYTKLLQGHEKVPEAEEGLALLALRAGRKEEAHRNFADAVEAESTSARCYIEFAKLGRQHRRPRRRCCKAIGINNKLDEPFAMMAERDMDPRMRIRHWKGATERNARNPRYWKALAEANLARA